MKTEYKRLNQLKVKIIESEGIDCVDDESLRAALSEIPGGIPRFAELFGCQTCSGAGMYAHDVEAVLERMISGRRIGSQLVWD